MSLVRWSPFDDAFHLAETFFGDRPARGFASSAWAPRVDITEDAESIRLEADLPGIQPDEVDVDVHDDVLTLKGERKSEETSDEDGYRRVERVFGQFERRFTLPPTVDQTRIEAKYRDGVLTLVIPKREERKPRKIAVNVERQAEAA